MATKHNQSSQGGRPAGITCPHYEALPGRKHCRHYLSDGACSRPDELMCTEWLKANGHQLPVSSRTDSIPTRRAQGKHQKLSTSSPVDLFGNPNPDYVPAAMEKGPTAATPSPAPAPEVVEERESLRGLTTEDIDSFKKLGVEVCLESEAFGEVWLVSEYTGRDRKEITPEHAATIARVMEAFPGSKVVSFEKSPQQGKEAE